MATTAVYYLSILLSLGVAVVLVMGLSTLLRGDQPNLSQKFMRWRIGLQFIAILVIMLFAYMTRGYA